MELKNKAVLITGGARMGAAIAETLAQNGCHVALLYRRSRASAESTAKRVRRLGRQALVVRADVTRSADVRRAVKKVGRQFGRLDILVNMASVYEKIPFTSLTDKDWSRNIETDLQHAYLFSKEAAPLLAKNGSGRIINFSDWLSRSGRPRYREYLPYYVAKSGILGLTEALALELAPRVLVNAIAPGPILPPDSMSRSERNQVAEVTPLKRWGGPGEIARAVLFLAQTEFVTGECIRVDGGRHLY